MTFFKVYDESNVLVAEGDIFMVFLIRLCSQLGFLSTVSTLR